VLTDQSRRNDESLCDAVGSGFVDFTSPGIILNRTGGSPMPKTLREFFVALDQKKVTAIPVGFDRSGAVHVDVDAYLDTDAGREILESVQAKWSAAVEEKESGGT
jgi:hypothetical protein